MDTLSFFTQPFWQQWALALLHFVWQGAAVAGLVMLVLRAGRFRRSRERYLCCLAGLTAMALSPLLTFALLAEPSSHVVSHSPTGLPVMRADVAADRPPTMAAWQDGVGASWRSQTFLAGVLLVWLTGVLLLGGRLVLGMTAVAGLVRRRRKLPRHMAAMVERLCDSLGVSSRTLVAASGEIREAMAVRHWRPVVLLPAAWVLRLPPEMLEAVIAHELAHIRRRDLWVNLMQRVVETLLFYHPAVWWLSGRLRVERELCCDELAVAATGRRLVYAETLELVARFRGAARRPLLATCFGGKPMVLLERVRNVLGMGSVERQTGWWPAGLIVLAAPGLLWLASATVPADAGEDREPAQKIDKPRSEADERALREEKLRRPEAERQREKGDAARPEKERPGVGERDEEKKRPDAGRLKDEEFEARSLEKRIPEKEQFRGDKPDVAREQERPPVKQPPRPLEAGERDELLRAIRHLQGELEQLRREVRELRGERSLPRDPRFKGEPELKRPEKEAFDRERPEAELREQKRREAELREKDPAARERREAELREQKRRELELREKRGGEERDRPRD